MLEKLKDMICEYVEVDKNAVTEIPGSWRTLVSPPMIL